MQKTTNIEVIILAAGGSSRFQTHPKQLAELDGRYLLDIVINTAIEAGFIKPFVVLGAYAKEITERSKLLCRCQITHNPDWQQGMSSSLKTGLASLHDLPAGALFLLADQPLISASLLIQMTKKFINDQPDILYPEYKGTRGNPVIISSRIFDQLIDNTGDMGGRFLFQRKDLRIKSFLTTDKSCIQDIDTVEDLELLKSIVSEKSINRHIFSTPEHH